jgi:CheY-like chemotaxis protein
VLTFFSRDEERADLNDAAEGDPGGGRPRGRSGLNLYRAQERRRLRLLEASSGTDALHLLLEEGQEEPFLVILTVETSALSGADYFAHVSRFPRLASIPVLILSRTLCLDAVVGYLKKPVDLDTLLEKVGELAMKHVPPAP